MTEYIIPLPDKTAPLSAQSVSLEGRSYVFAFDWNSRTDRWTLTLTTEDGDPVLEGAVLCIGVDILRTIPTSLDYAPPGQMWLVGDDDPRLDTIQGAALFYITST